MAEIKRRTLFLLSFLTGLVAFFKIKLSWAKPPTHWLNRSTPRAPAVDYTRVYGGGLEKVNVANDAEFYAAIERFRVSPYLEKHRPAAEAETEELIQLQLERVRERGREEELYGPVEKITTAAEYRRRYPNGQ